MKTRFRLILATECAAVAATASLCAALVGQAMSGGGFTIPAAGVNAGGGVAAGGASVVQFTIGGGPVQPMSGGGFTLSPGVVAARRAAALDIEQAHAYPTPFKPSLGHDRITFTRLTSKAQIDVFTLSGRRVAHFEKNDDTDSLVWMPVANEQGAPLASGVYLFVVHETNSAGGATAKNGKIMVIK